ncbi:uncharacterized protein LOC119584839 [Penaeus monodon]|uniref:uncharacterized protein LOC119584839 n=1 Tax=Penaeus monodon TaxID=6687 RepID=UPI0018A7DEAB|nr:uncharacterized protein LOC119584839 [Penaeus monodon]
MAFQQVVAILVLVVGVAKGSSDIFRCPGVGRFADAEDCTRYHVCLDVGRGLQAGWARCPSGQFFHPDLLTCLDWMEELPPTCRQNHIARAYEDPVIDGGEAIEKCDALTGEVCGYCKQIISCEGDSNDITTSHTMCQPGEYCLQFTDPMNGRLAGCFEECVDCQCPIPLDSVLHPDMYDDRTYFTCNDFETKGQRFFRCGTTQYFDPDLHACIERPPPTSCATSVRNCTNVGFFVLPEDCRQYYQCFYEVTDGDYNMTSECYECNQGEYFYPDLGCKKAADFECEIAGQFADVSDCHAYHLCVDFGGGLIHSHTLCPDDTYFDSKSGHCIHGTCESQCKTEPLDVPVWFW